MTMRISTAGMHNAALAGITERNASLIKTQNQIASGKKIQTPADDPSGAVRALEFDRALAESRQFARNTDVAVNRLSLEEGSLADITNLLDRVRTLTLQANNATVDYASRQAIAAEIEQRLRELVDLGNRQDANGEYLFSGFATQTQPFAQSATGTIYRGDQGVRVLQTSENQRMPVGHSGFDVFLNVTEANGTFTTSGDATNGGTGVISVGSVTNPAAWVADTYTLRFLNPPTTWEVVDGTNTQIATGAYVPDGTIAFNGIQVSVSGTPAAGDEFVIAPSGTEDMFATLEELLVTLRSPTTTVEERALFTTDMAGAIQQLDNALEHVVGVRADVGARLSSLEETRANREDRELELNRSISELRDLDYAEAITRLNLQLVGLEAAQASYSRISQLSLFDYL